MKSQLTNHEKFIKLLELAKVLVGECEKNDCSLRLIGSCATYYHITRINPKADVRHLKDLDFIFYSSNNLFKIIEVFNLFDYTYDKEMLVQTEGKRLVFYNSKNPNVTIDLISNPFNFAQKIYFNKDEFEKDELSLSPTAILLTRMQKVELSQNDILDLELLFRSIPIAKGHIEIKTLKDILVKKWGFYVTFVKNLEKLNINEKTRHQIVEELQRSKKTLSWHSSKFVHNIFPFLPHFQKVEKFV